MIYESDTPSIELECLDNRVREYCIPTSRIAKPGTEPIVLGSIGLVGFTLMVIIKEPNENDPSPCGIYMDHNWKWVETDKL